MQFKLFSWGNETYTHTPLKVICQTVVELDTALDVLGSVMNVTLVPVPLLAGGPVAITVEIGDSSHTKLEHYVAEVPEGGEVYYLPYQASETGVFVATVEARNMINGTTGTFKVEIVPYIVQAEWTITTEKPWATDPGDFEVTFSCSDISTPPWTASLSIYQDGIEKVTPVEVDIDPEGAAKGPFTFSSKVSFTLAALSPGIHTVQVNL
ncbi:uncharacterized protein LOC119577247 [Penaeus monodon]|uniref:uncharacterized protein LOC119577247 n=1 Tax=Penaeus monodon TaxID=6687 RepID=UPI0018A75C01|nr:uncharacterized protein LOC119577247 [Penaeus monodon]